MHFAVPVVAFKPQGPSQFSIQWVCSVWSKCKVTSFHIKCVTRLTWKRMEEMRQLHCLSSPGSEACFIIHFFYFLTCKTEDLMWSHEEYHCRSLVCVYMNVHVCTAPFCCFNIVHEWDWFCSIFWFKNTIFLTIFFPVSNLVSCSSTCSFILMRNCSPMS